MNTKRIEEEERISIKEVILRLRGLFFYLLSNWKLIIIGGSLIALLLITYGLVRSIKYTAETTFVVGGSSGQGSDISSLASVVGLPVNALGDKNGLFSASNIALLYKSDRMLRNTFMEIQEIEGVKERLITRYARKHNRLVSWQKKIPGFTWEIPMEKMDVVHDSLLFIIMTDFRKKKLTAGKVDRRLDLLSIKVTDTDPLFAQKFNQRLVENVNDFYIDTKTLKTETTLRILQKQADSVKTELDNTLKSYAMASESVPNRNSVRSSVLVKSQKLEIDLEVLSAVYKEVLRELELAKIKHQENIPIIQIVDAPILPLESNKFRKLYLGILSVLIGGFIMVFYLTMKRIFQSVMQD